MHLDKNQLKAVKANERNLLVVAAPGSGKTTVIINRIKYLVDEVGVYPSNIIVITFTKAAALNMKNRYINTFHKESSPFFGTFHGLFYKILLREGANINIIEGHEPQGSHSFNEVILYSSSRAQASDRNQVELSHLLDGIINLEESYAAYYLLSQVEWTDLLYELCDLQGEERVNKEVIAEEGEKKEIKDEGWKAYVTCLNDVVEGYSPLIGRE